MTWLKSADGTVVNSQAGVIVFRKLCWPCQYWQGKPGIRGFVTGFADHMDRTNLSRNI